MLFLAGFPCSIYRSTLTEVAKILEHLHFAIDLSFVTTVFDKSDKEMILYALYS